MATDGPFHKGKDMGEGDLRARLSACPGLYTTWLHHTGGAYVVTGRAVLEATGEALVIYRRADGGSPLACTLAEWLGVVEHDGRAVRRYEPTRP